MNKISELAIETCIYPYRHEKDKDIETLFIESTEGNNAGKWVPLGSKVEEHLSPKESATAILKDHCLSTHLVFRGLVTEVCLDQGWKNLLFLYTAQQNPQEQGGALECGSQWVTIPEISELDLPQADRHFDYRLLFSESQIFEATMHFDGDAKLYKVSQG